MNKFSSDALVSRSLSLALSPPPHNSDDVDRKKDVGDVPLTITVNVHLGSIPEGRHSLKTTTRLLLLATTTMTETATTDQPCLLLHQSCTLGGKDKSIKSSARSDCRMYAL